MSEKELSMQENQEDQIREQIVTIHPESKDSVEKIAKEFDLEVTYRPSEKLKDMIDIVFNSTDHKANQFFEQAKVLDRSLDRSEETGQTVEDIRLDRTANRSDEEEHKDPRW